MGKLSRDSLASAAYIERRASERMDGRMDYNCDYIHTVGVSERECAPLYTHPPGRDPNFGPAALLLSIQMRLVIVLQIENRLRSTQTETSRMAYINLGFRPLRVHRQTWSVLG